MKYRLDPPAQMELIIKEASPRLSPIPVSKGVGPLRPRYCNSKCQWPRYVRGSNNDFYIEVADYSSEPVEFFADIDSGIEYFFLVWLRLIYAHAGQYGTGFDKQAKVCEFHYAQSVKYVMAEYAECVATQRYLAEEGI